MATGAMRGRLTVGMPSVFEQQVRHFENHRPSAVIPDPLPLLCPDPVEHRKSGAQQWDVEFDGQIGCVRIGDEQLTSAGGGGKIIEIADGRCE